MSLAQAPRAISKRAWPSARLLICAERIRQHGASVFRSCGPQPVMKPFCVVVEPDPAKLANDLHLLISSSHVWILGNVASARVLTWIWCAFTTSSLQRGKFARFLGLDF